MVQRKNKQDNTQAHNGLHEENEGMSKAVVKAWLRTELVVARICGGKALADLRRND